MSKATTTSSPVRVEEGPREAAGRRAGVPGRDQVERPHAREGARTAGRRQIDGRLEASVEAGEEGSATRAVEADDILGSHPE